MKVLKKILKIFFCVFITAIILLPVSVSAAATPISLDGYFDDWNDKPIIYLRYGSIVPEQAHQVKEITDDNYLYMYIKMATKGGQRLQNYVVECHFNGSSNVDKHLQIVPDTPKVGRITVYDMDGGYKAVSQDGYVVRGSNSDGKTSDEAEFKIPLTEFKKEGAVGIENVSLKIPDLGEKYITFEIGSTGPYLGIALCSVIAIAATFVKIRGRL